jgi:NADH-quinone oxidoreductase subunit G
MSGNEILRVSARKDTWGEVEDTPEGKPGWICNTCRFDKKQVGDWNMEGPRQIDRHSVISQNKYYGKKNLRIDVSNQKQIEEKAHNS